MLEYAKKTPYFTYLRKLARRYKTVDIDLELQAFLWELLTFGNPPCEAYVLKCLKNKALALARKEYRRRENFIDDLEWIPAPEFENDLRIDLYTELTRLSTEERDLLTEIFLNESRVEDIAKKQGISRQAVNKKKLKAIAKMGRLKCYA